MALLAVSTSKQLFPRNTLILGEERSGLREARGEPAKAGMGQPLRRPDAWPAQEIGVSATWCGQQSHGAQDSPVSGAGAHGCCYSREI